MASREVETVCARDCPDSCFLKVIVENGRVVSVNGDQRNPITQGFVCPKGAADPKRIYSEQRILYPHARAGEKINGSFRRINWDEAIRDVSTQLHKTIERYGKESVLLLEYAGNTGLLSSAFPQRLWKALAATQTDHALCSSSGHHALALHYGLSHGLQPEELLNMRSVIFWGFNARVSSVHQWNMALRARRENGAAICVIDPRRSETADEADIWLDPRPGSDAALAYGLGRYLIEHECVDMDFIEKWTRGFQEYKEEAIRWTPELVEKTTRLKWDQIENLGETIRENEPAAFMMGIGLQKSLHGAEAIRAVSLIPALLGYHRGFYYTNSGGRFIDFGYLTGEAFTNVKPRIVSQVALGRRLQSGEFKFVFVYGMNPAVTLPDQKAVREGLSRNDVFVVVHDTHWTETARFADVVLPAPTYLEKEDIVISDSHPYTMRSRMAVEPLGESRSEVWLMRELAGKLGLEEGWLYEDPWNALERSLEGAFENGAFKDLLEGEVVKLRFKPLNEYQTPSGRIEFRSSIATDAGLSPLPVQHPLAEEGDHAIMLNSAVPKYLHTQFRDVYGEINPIAWVNPADAKRLGVVDGERMEIRNDNGALEVSAVVTDRVSEGVIWSPRPFIDLKGEPQNTIVPPTTQGIGGGPVFNSTRVKLAKIG